MASATTPRVFIYYHLTQIPGWETMLRDQLSLVSASGLSGVAERMVISTSVSSISLLKAVEHAGAARILIKQDQSMTAAEGEIPTLRLLWSDFQFENEEAYVFYFHQKGITHPQNECVQDWRRMMEYFCIERFEEAITALSNADAVGVNWTHTPLPHFSGNFWWARSSYLRTLSPLRRHAEVGIVQQIESDLQSPRHDAEFWIGTGLPRIAVLYLSGLTDVTHYTTPHPRSSYSVRPDVPREANVNG